MSVVAFLLIWLVLGFVVALIWLRTRDPWFSAGAALGALTGLVVAFAQLVAGH